MYKNIDDLPLIMTVVDVANILDMGKRQAYELVRTEGFPAFKIGTSIRIMKPLFIKWMEEKSKQGLYPK